MAEGWHQAVLKAAERAGMEPALRRFQLAFAERIDRRDARDRRLMRSMMCVSLATDANCIDIGANVGDILKEIVSIAPHGRHVAYEPLPELAAALHHRYPQVDVRNAAVSDANGEATFYRVKNRLSASSLSPDGLTAEDLEPIPVRLDTLDDALDVDFAPALIKIDVEGWECAVLRGARRLLSEHHPIVVFEHGSAPIAVTREIHELLTSLEFRIFDIEGRGPLSGEEFECTVRAGMLWTFVAHQ